MSFWGATVITSLVTTVPIVGKQIVFWLWGGLEKASCYSNIIKKILLNAGTCLKYLYMKLCYFFMSFVVFCMNKKKHIKLQYKEKMIAYNSNIRRSISHSSFYKKTLLINDSQRLNAESLQWLVGFFEGDGCFSVNKNGKYLKYEMAIEVSIRDIQLLYKIKEMLGNNGSITTRVRDTNIVLARFKIASKPLLINLILPIFDKYPMITNKQYDYLFFRECLLKNITYTMELPKYVRPTESSIINSYEILEITYFDNWLVGFIEAEGCFSTFFVEKDQTITASFSIVQKDGLEILKAIKSRLNITSNPFLDEKTKAYSLNTSSIRGVENVINFLKQADVRLLGYKKAQYLKWLHQLRTIQRYRTIKIPSNY
jgi:hypothetical protein